MAWMAIYVYGASNKKNKFLKQSILGNISILGNVYRARNKNKFLKLSIIFIGGGGGNKNKLGDISILGRGSSCSKW